MLVLGIETSCDETGLAILEFNSDGSAAIRGEVLASQVSLHEKYGGVVPELASREHMRSLPVLWEELIQKTGLSLDDINAIGVTCGPGLKGCLLMGITFAQGLALPRGVPVFPVNHIEGHILSGELHAPELKPPYITLVVSGGHTEILLVEGLGRYTCLCRTRDDAAGEAFDKSANLLDLQYPGGARLAARADVSGPSKRFALPKVAREMEDFSFSGLKTAVSLLIKRSRDEIFRSSEVFDEMCWVIQDSIIESLVQKTSREVLSRKLPLVVCGGVSANSALRKRLAERCAPVHFPPMRHCVDNGAMIAYVAGRYLVAGVKPPKIDIFSRWPVETLNDFYWVGHG
jgi:N6-L-threonylcarbamoyladenine synthase